MEGSSGFLLYFDGALSVLGIAFGLYMGFIGFQAIIRGYVGINGKRVDRTNEPLAYWLVVSGLVISAVLVLRASVCGV